MRASFALRAGRSGRPCEDWAGAGPTAVVVLDGLSTPPDDEAGCRHGTPWYVHQLGTALLAAASTGQGAKQDLAAALATAIEQVADRHRECDLASAATPSSAVALLRLQHDADELEYLLLADTAILLRSVDGLAAELLTDNRVDDVATDEVAAALEADIDTPQQRSALNDLMRAQRRVRNTPEGHWVAAADPHAAGHAITGTRRLSELAEAALLSDGASCITTTYGQLSEHQALEVLRTEGPDALIDRVRRAEASDPLGRRWPRFKTSDDATALYLAW